MIDKHFLKKHGKRVLISAIIISFIVTALKFGIDKKVVVFSTVVIGVFTQAFAGVIALLAAVPLVGPFIIKLFAIPFFWIINSMGSVVGAVAIKKGYGSEFTKSRVLTFSMLIGIVIGYILGHLIPMR